jgi:hypothetical protein
MRVFVPPACRVCRAGPQEPSLVHPLTELRSRQLKKTQVGLRLPSTPCDCL